ncbi:MAG TPA: hypothetical protein VF902_00240 [Coriobacteriia bacterium]
MAALRAELEARGQRVGSDTTGLKRDLYIGGTDRPSALFEFKASLEHAADSMYEGRWEPGMPRRVAVLPAPVGGGAIEELLEQAGILILSYGFKGDAIVFVGLDELMRRIS